MKIVTALKLIYGAFIKKNEQSTFVLAERITGLIYPKYKFSEFGRLYLEDEEFLRNYERLSGKSNYHSLDRKFAMDQLAQSVIDLDGDTAECGAYEGASSWFICRRLKARNKMHHVFDSFEGLSQPGEHDGAYWLQGDLSAREEITRQNLREFECVVYHKGWIPERFGDVAEKRFSFVHLDVDLYRPTLDSLTFFYHRIVPGGIILCDDYGFTTCPGARKAMDEFFKGRPERIVHLPTGQAYVMKR